MEYRHLGNSGLKVSLIGLGSDTFGRSIGEEASLAVIEKALDLGINFIDTADVYGGGFSEEWIGKAIKDRRSQVIIGTKFGMAVGKAEGGGPDCYLLKRNGSRQHIKKAVEASLRRLKTDYIDLYQMHFPDNDTPVEETLRALDDLIRDGKVRFIGCSNFPAWQLCEALWVSKTEGLKSFVSVQPKYNIIDRSIEQELMPLCQAYNLGVIPWFPLAAGFLTGKYRRGEPFPADSRFASDPQFYTRIMLSEANFSKLDKLQAFASERNHTIAELAIAWLAARPSVSTVIVGATRPDHIAANVSAAQWELTSDEIDELDKIQ